MITTTVRAAYCPTFFSHRHSSLRFIFEGSNYLFYNLTR
ncbi:hypothetical protein EYZ11_001396 [Aspergillus tanneri]|uniref:Uncharacterized protein n=1 Tax=Aspergillus tanneri TaxID=1220188 RepID=A0A4S3JUS2_9EURO|nr:hypothetical protein EYZ11_001396 [Aspergillus tanneri]